MPVFVLCTTAFSEVVMVAVVTLAVSAKIAVSDDSSVVIKPHEMMVRLKHEIRIMYKIFFNINLTEKIVNIF